MKILSSGVQRHALDEYHAWVADNNVQVKIYSGWPTHSRVPNLVIFDFASKDDALLFMLRFSTVQRFCKVLDDNNTIQAQNNT